METTVQVRKVNVVIGDARYRIRVEEGVRIDGDLQFPSFSAVIERDEGDAGWRVVHRHAGGASPDISIAMVLPWIMRDWMREHLALDGH